MKPSTARVLSAVAVFGIVAIGLAWHTGLGTPSSFGWDFAAVVCPLGIVETFLAGRTFAPASLICLAITVVLIVLLGRVFCGWLCPIPLLRRLFGGKKAVLRDVSDAKALQADPSPKAMEDGQASHPVPANACADCREGGCAEKRALVRSRALFKLKTSRLDSRHAVLLAALASTAVFGFPVFCLVCPVGLAFATFIGLWRLIQFNEISWMLVAFPLILIVELVVLRSWCHRFCPLGAVFSLIAKTNRTFRPTADTSICLRTTGKASCHACWDACPEGIDLHDAVVSVPMNECTKCRACVEVCPVNAIKMPLLPAKREGSGQEAGCPIGRDTGDPAASHDGPPA